MAMGPMGRRGMRPAEKSKRGLRGVQRELFSYSERIKLPMLIALVLAAAGAVLTILGPNQLSKITNLISDSLMGEIDLAAIGRVAGVLLGIYALSALLTYIEHYIMATVTLGLSKQMRRDLCAKINRVPMSYFNRIAHGDILSRVTNDVSTLQQALSNSLPSMISAVAQLTGCVIMMFVTEWRMALAAIAATMIGFVFMFIIMKRSQKYFVDRQESLGTLNGYIEEMYSGHDVVRISRANDRIKEMFRGMNRAVYEANRKSQFLSGIMQPLMNVIGNLGYVAVCIVGATLTMSGAIRFGTVIAFISYVKLFTNPLSQISQAVSSLMSAGAAGERVFGFLAEEEMPDDSGCTAHIDHVRGKVEFENVRFGYDEDKPIIHDFSADIEPGQKVAIVGYTGAGKTTMVNLLMRFYELWSGQIKIDGVPVSEMRRSDVHAMFGMVLQDTWLFDGTYRENIAYGKPGVTDEQVEAACKLVGLDHYIKTLPKGYDTELNDRSSLSAGQRQLLTIARAMVENAPMIILDEATSSVDTRTEVLVQKAMDRLARGRTSFVIAHRLSTIRDADLILVMDKGDIVESGTHEQLLGKGGLYKELYTSQFENK